jgi:hypothetical protein
MELKGELDEPLEATVIEAKMDKGLGVVVTALVQKGIIRSGQTVIAGPSYGKIRFILDDKGKAIPEAFPATPIRVSYTLLLSLFHVIAYFIVVLRDVSVVPPFVLCSFLSFFSPFSALFLRLLDYHVFQQQVKKYY